MYFGLDSSSGVDSAAGVDTIGFDSTNGDGELARSLSALKSALNSSGLFLPLPLNLLAHDRSENYEHKRSHYTANIGTRVFKSTVFHDRIRAKE